MPSSLFPDVSYAETAESTGNHERGIALHEIVMSEDGATATLLASEPSETVLPARSIRCAPTLEC